MTKAWALPSRMSRRSASRGQIRRQASQPVQSMASMTGARWTASPGWGGGRRRPGAPSSLSGGSRLSRTRRKGPSKIEVKKARRSTGRRLPGSSASRQERSQRAAARTWWLRKGSSCAARRRLTSARRSGNPSPWLRGQREQSPVAPIKQSIPFRARSRKSFMPKELRQGIRGAQAPWIPARSQAAKARVPKRVLRTMGRKRWTRAVSGQAGTQRSQPSQRSGSIPSRSSSITQAPVGQASTQARHRAWAMWPWTQRSARKTGNGASGGAGRIGLSGNSLTLTSLAPRVAGRGGGP